MSVSFKSPFILYCFILAIYLGLNPLLTKLWGPWGISGGQLLFFLCIPLLYILLRYPRHWIHFYPITPIHFNLSLLLLLSTALCLAFLNFLLNWQFSIFPIPTVENANMPNLSLLAKLLHIALIPALCEEAFFRGCLQTYLIERFSPIVGIFLSSLLFALGHFDLYFAGYYFLLGIFFGSWQYFSGNLWYPFSAHLLTNLYSVINI